ncbi:MAG: tRNA (N6-isopentenyl adenosine(37)-C2)-methylthiotransferase MiaB [Desulfomonile tiedjei]|nr:tRNA (N6-isopentenyl adenosine(37)-C2)-methylthiotransferase MiaB [Desulfomonile tiedjei]
MNEHDSEKMASLLEGLGLTPASEADKADVFIVNTCAIREKAEHKVYSALGKLTSYKAKNPAMVAVVAGCVAQQEKEKLLKRVRDLDAVLGTHQIAELPAVIEKIKHDRSRIVEASFCSDAGSLHIAAPRKGRSPVCSFVTIMQGCSNFCSYCVVPFTRGPEQSRARTEIISEVKELAARGVKEITLLGQNVNAYGKDRRDGDSFAGLLSNLDQIPGLLRVRFTTSHPRDFDDDLANAMADLGTVCEHIHLPLQSGSDRILRAMNRGYTFPEYRTKIRTLREAVPGVAITADMIVGFPGETEEDFQQTLQALEEIRFDQIFSFKFSARPNTAARRLPLHFEEEIKAERLAKVHALQDRITQEYHHAAEGTVEEVLIEGTSPKSGQLFGRTRTNKIVNLDAANDARVGDLIEVEIVRGLNHSLVGHKIGRTTQDS